MKALELADELDTINKQNDIYCVRTNQAATMLRKLQKEHNGLCNLVFEYQDKTDELRETILQLQTENRRCIEALNKIGSGTITGEETNYKAIVSVIRDIANDALYELNRNTMMTWDDVNGKAQEK